MTEPNAVPAAEPGAGLIELPCNELQVQQIAAAWAAYESARERVQLVFGGILAAHGFSEARLESFRTGPSPAVIIRVPDPASIVAQQIEQARQQ